MTQPSTSEILAAEKAVGRPLLPSAKFWWDLPSSDDLSAVSRGARLARESVKQHVRLRLFEKAWHEFVCLAPRRPSRAQLFAWAEISKEQYDANRAARTQELWEAELLGYELEIPWSHVYFYGSRFERDAA